MARNETVLPERQITSLDVLEILQALSGFMVVRRGNGSWAMRVLLLDQATGTVALTRVGSPDGSFWRRLSTVANQLNTSYMIAPQWPVGYDRSLDPVTARYPMRWEFSLEARRTGPLLANAPCCIGLIGDVPNDPTLSGHPMYLLHSLSTENGGNWTVYYRARDLGPLIKMDTGIDPTANCAILLQYDDTTNPRIALSINGVEVDHQQGVANVPQYPSTVQNWSVGAWQGFSAGGAAGQVDFWRNARLKITELPGYPD